MKKFVVISGNNPGVIKRALLKRGNWEDVTEEKLDGEFDNVHFVWKPTNLAIRSYAKMDSNSTTDILPLINHFENNRGICTKTGLIRSLRSYYYNTEQALMSRYTLFESTPTTFLITAGDENQEYVNFIARFRDIAKKHWSKEHIPDKHCQENVWLIKPANMNQGRGIEIFNNLKDIQNFIQSQTINSYWVAQKYIEKPLLYYGRKFDIRVWVIVTAKNEIFFYKKPYMRTSSDIYVTNVFHNYVHLTNNCLQKHGENFGKFENGNTLPLSTLQDYMEEQFPQHNLNLDKHIIPRMKDLIIDTILSVKKTMNPKRRKNCFELFGYDFLIDEDFRTWLLEVNTNPYLGVPNDYIKDLLPEMVDDMFKIVLDPIYPPTNPDLQLKEGNDFELIYCDYHSVYHEGSLNVRSQYHENIYPIPSTAPNLRHIRAILHQDKENKDIRETKEVTSSAIGVKSQQDEVPEESRKPKQTILLSAKIRKAAAGKVSSIISVEQSENPINLSPRTSREKRSSLIAPPTQEKPIINQNNVQDTVKKIDVLLETYLTLENEDLMPLISRLLSVLGNWELHSDKEISTTCKSILTLSESRMCSALTEPNNITQMINLLDSQNVPLKVQITLIKAFLNVCRKISEKKKIVCDKMIHALIRITLTSCDAIQIQNYDLQITKLAAQCLSALSGRHDRRMYIPGETRDHDKVRDFLIHQGGILALLVISKQSLDEEIKEMPGKECFCYLGISDWELQKTVLEKTRDDKGNTQKDVLEEDTDGSASGTNARSKNNMGFLFPGTTFTSMPKLDNKKITETHYIIPTVTPNIPKSLLERENYTVDAMIEDIEETITFLREEKKKKEQEEEERREQALIELMKEQQQKELVMSERKRKAEDLFLKRLEEKKKQQEDITKKMEEEIKLRQHYEEERKKTKMLELIKKKEEFDKKAKAFELKKKKHEEETRKMIDEEIEKKKTQRKALEESFWTRVRAKEKEKQLEKIQLTAELSKRKEEQSINADRTLSVEPIDTGRHLEDSVEKPNKLLKTQTALLRQVSQPIDSTKSNTFSNFYPEESQFKTPSVTGSHTKQKRKKGGRQRSVEDIRGRGKGKEESSGLPYIDSGKRKTKESFEKNTKVLKTSNLFTLDEALPDEETNTFADEKRMSSPVMRKLVEPPQTMRNEETEKLRRIINSTETMKARNIMYIKEYAATVEKSKEKANLKHKESSSSKVVRQSSPQSLNDFAQTSPYKVGLGTKKKFRVQQAMVKH